MDISHRCELDEFHLIWGIDTKTTLWYNQVTKGKGIDKNANY